MNNELQAEEKRQHNRLIFKDIAYAIVNTDNTLVGHMIDISEGGMAFSYVGSHLIEQNEITIDIFLHYLDLHLRNIPVLIINNFYLQTDLPASRVPMMRCGASFNNINAEQKKHLQCIINSLAGDEAAVLS